MKHNNMLYSFYGIYIDWQIDYNLLPKVLVDRDVNEIDSYNDFINSSKWQIHRIFLNDQYYLIFDINLPHYNFNTYQRLNTELIMENIKGYDLPEKIAKYSQELNLPILDILSFYLSRQRSISDISADSFLSDYESVSAMN